MGRDVGGKAERKINKKRWESVINYAAIAVSLEFADIASAVSLKTHTS